eukprot:3934266-Rhodomonas_salina.1
MTYAHPYFQKRQRRWWCHRHVSALWGSPALICRFPPNTINFPSTVITRTSIHGGYTDILSLMAPSLPSPVLDHAREARGNWHCGVAQPSEAVRAWGRPVPRAVWLEHGAARANAGAAAKLLSSSRLVSSFPLLLLSTL